MQKFFLFLLFLPFLAAWSPDEASPQKSSPIITGELIVENEGTCKYSMLAPDIVLTSAHCIMPASSSSPYDRDKIHVTILNPPEPPRSVGVLNIAIIKGFRHHQKPDRSTIKDDKAIIQIDQPVIGQYEKIISVPSNLTQVEILDQTNGEQNAYISCPAHLDQTELLIINCANYKGTSGKPVFAHIGQSRRIVGIISAGGISRNKKAITFATLASTNISKMNWFWK